MKIYIAFFLVGISACQIMAEKALCRDGITECDGCQCCPDLTTCPGANITTCEEPCPNDPAMCSDGVTECNGCQCCPDLTMCPNARLKQYTCDFKCPNDEVTKGTRIPLNLTTAGFPTILSTLFKLSSLPPVVDPSSQPPTSTPIPETGGEHLVTFINKCPYDIWAGALNAPTKTLPQKGGWFLKEGGAPYSLSLPSDWAGRFWGRTDCHETASGQLVCATGDCGRNFECNGAGGEPPITLAEFNFGGEGKVDYYDVSVVDGFNVPIIIRPVTYTYVPGSGVCFSTGCDKNINLDCPPELRLEQNGKVIGCQSPCNVFKEHRFCCTGDYDCAPYASCQSGMKKCDPTTWPFNYSQMFKNACPGAYTFPYDDPSSTFTCLGKPVTNYDVIFCP